MTEVDTFDNDKLQDEFEELLSAIDSQDTVEMRRLLEAKPALVHAWSQDDDETALRLATLWQRVEESRILLNSGADPNRKDKNGQTPLHLAAKYRQIEMMLLYMQSGANVNMQDHRGRTPLHIVNYDNLRPKIASRATKLLLKHGADPNIADEDGNCPLHFVRVNVRSAVYLIGSGADVQASNREIS